MAIILQDEEREPPRESLAESLLTVAEMILVGLAVFVLWGFFLMWSGM